MTDNTGDHVGGGFDPSRVFVDAVGALLDKPSLYMSGPSHQSRAKAEQILKWLRTTEGRKALVDAPNLRGDE